MTVSVLKRNLNARKVQKTAIYYLFIINTQILFLSFHTYGIKDTGDVNVITTVLAVVMIYTQTKTYLNHSHPPRKYHSSESVFTVQPRSLATPRQT